MCLEQLRSRVRKQVGQGRVERRNAPALHLVGRRRFVHVRVGACDMSKDFHSTEEERKQGDAGLYQYTVNIETVI